jgi:hypothetical protein
VNKTEKFIYNILRRNPRVKNSVRDIYQTLFSVIPVEQKIANESMISRPGYFFGFHDKSPWSFDDNYLLANKFSIPNRIIHADDSIEVGFFRGHEYREFIPLAITKSFNWQQGCFSQWVGKKNEIIFNSFDGEKNVSIIVDTTGRELKRFELPVAALSPDGKYALSYNFNRLARYARGYGYENGTDEEELVKMPAKQGLSIIHIETGEIKKLFSVAEIAETDPDPAMENAFHFFTHCLFSPSGNRFVFYHRSIRDMNFVRTRMFSCDLLGENKFIFPTAGMVSHIGWRDAGHILSYCRTENFGDGYTLFQDQTGNYQRIGADVFTSDGHPSYSPADTNYFITDTYPDRFRLSTLILFNALKNKRLDLARLKQPLQFKDELRCDLHPRWNRAGNKVCFDSAHTGMRSLCTLDISKELQNLV